MLVHDDQVDAEPLHAPVFMSAQQLANLGHILHLVDAKKDDRQIAGNAERPQARLGIRAAHEGGGRVSSYLYSNTKYF